MPRWTPPTSEPCQGALGCILRDVKSSAHGPEGLPVKHKPASTRDIAHTMVWPKYRTPTFLNKAPVCILMYNSVGQDQPWFSTLILASVPYALLGVCSPFSKGWEVQGFPPKQGKLYFESFHKTSMSHK